MKRLQKSCSPNVTASCIVPDAGQVPFMCRLLKYFETETTIFLLIEYVPHGRLFQHLSSCCSDGELFLKQLNKSPLDTVEAAQIVTSRRKSLTMKLNNSFTDLAVSTKRRSSSFRTIPPTDINLLKPARFNSVEQKVTLLSSDSSSVSSSDSLNFKKNAQHVSKVKFANSDENSSSSKSSNEMTKADNKLKWPLNVFGTPFNFFKNTKPLHSIGQGDSPRFSNSHFKPNYYSKQSQKWFVSISI